MITKFSSLHVFFFSLFIANQSVLDDIYQNIDFSYVRILKMMYAEDEMVRLLAGAALAAFSYNNINQQKVIAEQGGVRFNCFVPFLQSNDEFFRCNAAFQVCHYSVVIYVFWKSEICKLQKHLVLLIKTWGKGLKITRPFISF